MRVVSVCAGQGNDLVGVLTRRSDAYRVHAALIEKDPRNVSAAREGAATAGLDGITIMCADAGDFAAYRTAVPPTWSFSLPYWATSATRIRATIAPLSRPCAPGATVVWTRRRRDPDCPRQSGAGSPGWAWVGFTERAFDAPPDALFSVGVHLFHGQPESPPPSGRIFTFVR
ncbi:hypothetical protein GCM10022225_74380 [Plantactinospora mayteni]|uniref:SAM-dependent methyltransferase n=1 Tax=Plantactinospora mayteni TaxID=566021 RepID=UPI001EF73D2E|nr:SAM-dependent methyltransferase [Plantactinospora mayteni]